LALAWLLQRPAGSIIPILGARTLAQFEANMQCLNIKLGSDQVGQLDAINPPAAVYPASLFKTEFYQQMLHGNKGRLKS